MKWWWLSMAVVTAAVVAAIFWWMSDGPEVALVSDGANLLTKAENARVATYHTQLLEKFDIDYRIVMVNGSEDINQFAEGEFDRLRAGSLSTQNRGLLLVVDPEIDQVRLEVGYAVEPVFTDAFIAYLERQQMVPFFRSGRIADGVLAASELIVEQADKATKNLGWTRTTQQGSGGGGARTKANIDAGSEPSPSSELGGVALTGSMPKETLNAYLVAMAAHQASPNLSIYTEDTQAMLRDWTVTPAQMDNVVETTRHCERDSVKVNEVAGLAVIRYAISSRKCPPYFFRRVEGKWRLDLVTPQEHIRFSVRNHWRFVNGPPEEFAFAFNDWSFNQFGFPH